MLEMRAAVLAAVAIAVAGVARADDCAVPLAAALKLDAVPYHMTMKETSAADKVLNGDANSVSEVITTADKMYVNVNGTWHATEKVTHDDDDLQNAMKSSTCAYLRDEAVGGTDAAVYHVSDKSDPDATMEETLWIAKDGGHILRMDIDTDVGGGDVGKSHSSSLFDYTNVSPPANAE